MPVAQQLTKNVTYPELTPREYKEAPLIAKFLHHLKLALGKNNGDVARVCATATTAGTAANLPPASTPGRLYYATDTNVLYADDGTTWHAH